MCAVPSKEAFREWIAAAAVDLPNRAMLPAAADLTVEAAGQYLAAARADSIARTDALKSHPVAMWLLNQEAYRAARASVDRRIEESAGPTTSLDYARQLASNCGGAKTDQYRSTIEYLGNATFSDSWFQDCIVALDEYHHRTDSARHLVNLSNKLAPALDRLRSVAAEIKALSGEATASRLIMSDTYLEFANRRASQAVVNLERACSIPAPLKRIDDYAPVRLFAWRIHTINQVICNDSRPAAILSLMQTEGFDSGESYRDLRTIQRLCESFREGLRVAGVDV